MKLLLDENLSDRIVREISPLLPGSAHVKGFNLIRASDQEIWDFALLNGFALISKDSDFHQRSLLLGAPPKFIYLRVGNCPTATVLEVLHARAEIIGAFLRDLIRSSRFIFPRRFPKQAHPSPASESDQEGTSRSGRRGLIDRPLLDVTL